jgi:Flp pilus assembly protein TadG
MHFEARLRAFARQTDGSVAIMFALAMGATCLAAGIAIDYARAFSIQTSIQADLDAAMLGAASHIADPAKMGTAAQQYFATNWTAKHDANDVNLTVSKVSDMRIRGTVTATVPTTIMNIAGYATVPIGATSEIEVSGNEIEMTLVLDTTASMAGTKMSVMKTNAKTLIRDAFAAPNADDHVKLSIVPFGQYVNVGMSNRGASWMDVPLDANIPRQSCYDHENITGTSNCRMETFTGFSDGVPTSWQSEVCDHTYGPPIYRCDNWTENQVWYGCAGSRDNPLDIDDTAWGTPVPGIMAVGCGSEVLPLTNSKQTLINKIDSLTTSGDTYIPSGLFWGWTTLSKQAPYNQARDYGEVVDGKPVRKIMVLMTDGFNTLSPIYPEHTGTDTTQSNALTADLCNNIKAQDIELYTVAFEVTDNTIKDVLEACATSGRHFFDADSAGELSEAFRAIAGSFTPLRLAR